MGFHPSSSWSDSRPSNHTLAAQAGNWIEPISPHAARGLHGPAPAVRRHRRVLMASTVPVVLGSTTTLSCPSGSPTINLGAWSPLDIWGRSCARDHDVAHASGTLRLERRQKRRALGQRTQGLASRLVLLLQKGRDFGRARRAFHPAVFVRLPARRHQARFVDRRPAASTRLRNAWRLLTCMREKLANQPSRMRFRGPASSA